MAALIIQHFSTPELSPALASAIQSLCDDAYQTDTKPYFEALGAGDHLVGLIDGVVISHLMWVTRWLQPAGQSELRTAYVEMVATTPASQRHGYATTLLEDFMPRVQDYDIAALCPATVGIYQQLGWTFWRGPLSARKDSKLIATPEERVMILPTAKTPRLDLDAALSIEWRNGEVW
jgi:aminoglycoside 2'-N-acetyltransferase I